MWFIRAMRLMGLIRPMGSIALCLLFFTLHSSLFILFTSCEREPVLHLYEVGDVTVDLPIVDLDLQVYWDYEIGYDWKAEWYYGWDETDVSIFGEMGYTEPNVFELRRYFTGSKPMAPHTSVLANVVEGTTFRGQYDWGYWDFLVWNQVFSLDGVQSLIFDEQTSLDTVIAYTNASMYPSRYHAPRYTQAFYEPEPLFAAYDRAVEINRDLDGFVFDPERNVWVKKLGMTLVPITYIYLPQIILHHNKGRITSVEGNGGLSGMARTTVVNTGVAGSDAIAVYFHTRMKKNCNMKGERVDIIGGRLMTFGICNTAANRVSRADNLNDVNRHYIDVSMQFNNGIDSTFVFDVTRQVRERYKGGVLTVELDMDTVPIPTRRGGSGFNAVVKDFEDGGTHEFEM